MTGLVKLGLDALPSDNRVASPECCANGRGSQYWQLLAYGLLGLWQP